jgi:hypothetical protein
MTDELARAIDVVLDILSPAALDEHLTYLPGRCSFCGFHSPTQGHAVGCLDGPRGDEETYPALFRGSDICRDCGEPYGQDALSTRCLRRHWRWQDRPCERCAGSIDYRAERFLPGTKTVNPKSLQVGRITSPAQGKKLGWDKELTNALSNKQPMHAACAGARSSDAS